VLSSSAIHRSDLRAPDRRTVDRGTGQNVDRTGPRHRGLRADRSPADRFVARPLRSRGGSAPSGPGWDHDRGAVPAGGRGPDGSLSEPDSRTQRPCERAETVLVSTGRRRPVRSLGDGAACSPGDGAPCRPRHSAPSCRRTDTVVVRAGTRRPCGTRGVRRRNPVEESPRLATIRIMRTHDPSNQRDSVRPLLQRRRAALAVALSFCALSFLSCSGTRPPSDLARAGEPAPESASTRGSASIVEAAATQESDSLDLPEDREAAGAIERFRADYPGLLRQDRRFYSSREHFDLAYPDSFWNAYIDTLPSNEQGKLAWEASRWMAALIVMYQATGDTRYLERVWRYAETAMKLRDDRSGLRDYRDRSLPAWGSSRYVVGQRRHFLVHTGLIVEPILEMLLALRGELPMPKGSSGPLDVPWAQWDAQERLLRDCLEAIDLHEDRYRTGLDESEGYFLEDDSEWEPQPFNAQNIFAYDLQLAYLLSGREQYRDRARGVMQFFANRLQVTAPDGYIWEYVAWPISPDRP